MCPPSTEVINDQARPNVNQMIEKIVNEFSAYCSNPTSKERRHMILNLLYALDETYKMDMMKTFHYQGQDYAPNTRPTATKSLEIMGMSEEEAKLKVIFGERDTAEMAEHAGDCMTVNGGECSCR